LYNTTENKLQGSGMAISKKIRPGPSKSLISKYRDDRNLAKAQL